MVATSIEGADELAAPLDLLLTSSAVGMAERMMPNTSWSRFALNLARKPGVLGNGGQGRVAQSCRGNIIETDDRNLPGYVHATLLECMDGAHGDQALGQIADLQMHAEAGAE